MNKINQSQTKINRIVRKIDSIDNINEKLFYR